MGLKNHNGKTRKNGKNDIRIRKSVFLLKLMKERDTLD
jgi:hypothetical protein